LDTNDAIAPAKIRARTAATIEKYCITSP